MERFWIVFALFLKFILEVSATSNQLEYPPCLSQSTFTIQNRPSATTGDADFAFLLSADFNNYTSLCSGKWKDEWQECNERSEDFTAMFRGTASGYLDITHRYLCKRQDDPAGNDGIALAIANGTVILDFSQGDSITLNAYIQTTHRKPNTACTDPSQHPAWVVDGFEYAVGYLNTPGGPGPGGVAGVIASVSFDLLNKANAFSVSCTAIYTSGSLSIENDTIIDPRKNWPCPSPYGSDSIPADEYPTTSFRFDKAKRQLTLRQQWECDDHNGRISFFASGDTILPPECTTVPQSSCNTTKFIIDGELDGVNSKHAREES